MSARFVLLRATTNISSNATAPEPLRKSKQLLLLCRLFRAAQGDDILMKRTFFELGFDHEGSVGVTLLCCGNNIGIAGTDQASLNEKACVGLAGVDLAIETLFDALLKLEAQSYLST